MNQETAKFADAYAALKESAERMRAMQEPDVDQIIPILDRGLASAAVCRVRIEAARRLVAERVRERRETSEPAGDTAANSASTETRPTDMGTPT